MYITRIFFIAMIATSLASCKEKKDEKKTTAVSKESPDHDAHEENPAEVSLTQEQVRQIGIEFGQVESKELNNSIKASGVLTVPNQNKAFVTPLYPGVVKSLYVQPGTIVRAGQTIAVIVNPDLLQRQQQLQQVNAQIALAEIEVKRQEELVEGNAAPLKRLQQARTELLTLRSQRTGLQKQLGAVGGSQKYSSAIAVKAPISGAVSNVRAQLGSNVDVSSPIAEIVNNSELHLDIFVYEKDLPKVKPGQTIHFTVTNNAGKEYDATIFSIGSAFEPGSKTVPVHAEVKGEKSGLIDGMNVTALISLNKSSVPAVPAEAIVNFQGTDFIFVVKQEAAHTDSAHRHAGEKHEDAGLIVFEKIPVKKGTTDIGYSEIILLQPIPQGSKIVTKNAFFILAKMTNSGDHAH